MEKETENLKKFMFETLGKDNSGHNHQHSLRVLCNAEEICKKEKCNNKIVIAAAILHDCADKKLFKNPDEQYQKIENLLIKNNFSKNEIEEILYIIKNISFNEGNFTKLENINAKIVRDADRLDAIGAIGIVRTIEFGCSKNRLFYSDANIKTVNNVNQFNVSDGSTLSHFYDKLLKLKDLMETKTAKKMADERHKLMEKFLKQFYNEIERKD